MFLYQIVRLLDLFQAILFESSSAFLRRCLFTNSSVEQSGMSETRKNRSPKRTFSIKLNQNLHRSLILIGYRLKTSSPKQIINRRFLAGTRNLGTHFDLGKVKDFDFPSEGQLRAVWMDFRSATHRLFSMQYCMTRSQMHLITRG